jgi:hypothetical protein
LHFLVNELFIYAISNKIESKWLCSRNRELTRQQMELALAAAARKDEAFGLAVTELVARLREAEQAANRPVIAGADSKAGVPI